MTFLNRTTFRLRTTLIVPFVLQIVTTVGLVGYLSFRNGQKAVTELASELSTQASDRVSEQLSSYLDIPRQVNEMNLQAIDLGILNPEDLEITTRFFWRQMKVFDNLSYINFGNEAGLFIGVGREDNGSLYTEQMTEADDFIYQRYALDEQGNRAEFLAREEYPFQEDEWYQSVVLAEKPLWSSIYAWEDRPDIISIAASYPVYNEEQELIGVVGVDFILSQISDFLGELNVSPSSRIFIIERDGMIVGSSSPEAAYKEVDGEVQRLSILESPDRLMRDTAMKVRDRLGDFPNIDTPQHFLLQLSKEPAFVSVTPWQDKLGLDWLVVVIIPEADFMEDIHASNRNTILLCFLTFLLALIVGFLTARRISQPIEEITAASAQMAAGKLKQSIRPRRILELATLAKAFNTMAGQLETAFNTLEKKVEERTADLVQANAEINLLNEKLKTENLRMVAELDLLQQMQKMILPRPEELNIDGLDIAGFMEPADEVGGDYYDVLEIDGVVTISMGDVTGHGLESGILMLMTQTAVRTLKEIREQDHVRFLDILNRTLYKNLQRMQSDKNLTLVLLNYSDKTVSISGQHEETLVIRNGGEIERIDTTELGLPLGLDDDIADFIKHTVVELEPGDSIVLYTDGITEAKDINKKQYGLDQLCAIISQHWQASAHDIKEAVIEDVRRHIGKQQIFDDITLLVLKQEA
ncbi:SpoIIE family protein phosphatase [Spirulina subsalsa]|uniref:SpoIIE family protein phosphatase n=1 Tax=Spirulina subsalsa TaxID=54311 RepID=UPI0002DF5AF9|nr:SpoIIE family protein phosphatase [Spirulina subsalsa]